jgi:hypothetical protein
MAGQLMRRGTNGNPPGDMSMSCKLQRLRLKPDSRIRWSRRDLLGFTVNEQADGTIVAQHVSHASHRKREREKAHPQ